MFACFLRHLIWCNGTFSVKTRLLSSEVIISTTSIQHSLNELIKVWVPLLLSVFTVFSLAATSTILWMCSVFTVAVFVSSTTSFQNVTACMIKDIMLLTSPSFLWQSSRRFFRFRILPRISFISLSAWKNQFREQISISNNLHSQLYSPSIN